VNVINDHLYTTFFNKITGNSMEMWMSQVDEFRRAVHDKFVAGDPTMIARWPFAGWRVFGFIDDKGIKTTRPGVHVRREQGITADIQRAFYSGYFAAHGLKVQVVQLPNGMIRSVFVASLCNSDSGMLNLSGLNLYLTSLLQDHGLLLEDGFEDNAHLAQ
jgi:hypothetical protein